MFDRLGLDTIESAGQTALEIVNPAEIATITMRTARGVGELGMIGPGLVLGTGYVAYDSVVQLWNGELGRGEA